MEGLEGGKGGKGMSKVEVESHVDDALFLLKFVKENALKIIGQKAENYATDKLTAPKGPKGNRIAGYNELRQSITYQVVDNTVYVGSSLQIAPYIELGTGREYQPPPEWMEYIALPRKDGKYDKHSKAGVKQWIYYDEIEQVFKIGMPITAQPYLRPAIADHLDEYREIIKQELAENGMTTVKG